MMCVKNCDFYARQFKKPVTWARRRDQPVEVPVMSRDAAARSFQVATPISPGLALPVFYSGELPPL